jgi:hypothetical protein
MELVNEIRFWEYWNIWSLKNEEIKIYKNNFAFSLALVWNLVSDISGRPQVAGIWEQDAEENILKNLGYALGP